MNPAKKAIARTAKFVADHRVAVAVVTTATVTTVVVRKTVGNMLTNATDFIAEKGLLEEFHATFEDKI